MSQPVISVEGLGKRYFIGNQARHDTLRDRLAHGARGLLQRWRDPASRSMIEEFWALRDVSFQVNQGDVVGIIGRNGAGKSTLLKILSRITEPTTGRATIRGRVASLLEVGTGFHPELTGRENIFLNGAILGMSRAEITRKFDEIVAFAEVERFLDTPVKHYSSGMYVRLAFAVAAHLEPEILIVDEVLAVGDAEFQKRCLGKMRSVARNEGRTVLVVSHNLNQVATLAGKGLLLQQGRTVMAGDITSVIQRYFGNTTSARAEWTAPAKPASAPHVRRIRVQTSEPGNVQAYGRTLILEFELHHPEPVKDACFSFQILNSNAQPAVHLWLYSSDRPYARGPGSTLLRCEIPFVRLNVGHYTLRTYFSGPPGSPFFEMTEPDMAFEVTRLDQATLFGWRSETCAYFETASWDINPVP
jgi:lipopolysaccharide transport system ATP-binding protein